MRLSLLTAMAGAMALASACSSDKNTSPNPTPASIAVPASLSLVAGQDTTLSASVDDGSGDPITSLKVMYESSDTTVVKIGSDGMIMAVGAGTATLTAFPVDASGNTVSSVTATISVTVASPSAVSLAITGHVDSLTVGDSTVLGAVALTSSGDTLTAPAVTWTSSDTTLATVNGGTVHALAAGAVVITAGLDSLVAHDSITVVPAASPSRQRRVHTP